MDYTIGVMWQDTEGLNDENNCYQKEIDKVALECKMLFKIVSCLENCIKELDGVINTQKYDITCLKRNIEMLDGNVCCCDCLLSPEPHCLSDEEGLEYSTDSEYQEALMAPVNPSPSPPPPTTPPSNFENPHFLFFNPDRSKGQATGFGDNVALDCVADLEEKVPLPLENLDPIPMVVGCGHFCYNPREIDFIPFEVCGQRCHQSKGVPKLLYHPYLFPSMKGQCCCNLGGWCQGHSAT